MAKFLLWNVQRKPLESLVLTLVGQHAIDVVLLVEYAADSSLLEEWFGRLGYVKTPSQTRFGVFARATISFNRLPISALTSRVDYFEVTFPSRAVGLIALLHNFDRRNSDEDTRAALFQDVVANLKLEEGRLGTRSTIVLGDFNANPFERSVVGVGGLHAIGVRSVRERTSRKVAGLDRDFFYNPMWRLYGHGADAGSASFHLEGYNAYELIWHMLDQVVIRPESVAWFPEDRLQIVSHVGRQPLTRESGIPNKDFASDHLPIIFEWNL